jgi:hypothetical protein
MPRFVNESMKLLQAADVMEREQQQRETDEREYARIFGGAAPAGVSAPAAPAGGVAPAAAPAAANAVAPQMTPELADAMLEGGEKTSMLRLGQPDVPGVSIPREAISTGIGADSAPVQTKNYIGQSDFLNRLRFGPEAAESPVVRELYKPSTQPAPEFAFGNRPESVAQPAAAPQPEPAPVVTPRASAAAGVQVAGPMVAGAAPAAGEDEIAALETQRERIRTSRLSATRKKDEIAEIDRKLGILRGGDKDQVRSRMRAMGLPETREGFAEYFRMSQPQLGVAEQRLELDRQRMEIDRRRFEVAQAKNEADARAAQRNLSLAERKYELSIRQFELQSDPAYQARMAQARTVATETAKSDVAALAEAPIAIEQGNAAMALLNRMVGDPNAKGAAAQPHAGFQGVIGATLMPGARLAHGTPEADFDAMLEQVLGGAFLEAYERLAGTGQVTEIEGKKATQAITRMQRSVSESEFLQAAKEFRSALQTALDRTNTRLATARTRTQPPAPAGAGAQPPAAPAAPAGGFPAPTQAAIDALKRGQGTDAQFDAIFGPGAAAKARGR